jgi:CheY-like chemotaxis protein
MVLVIEDNPELCEVVSDFLSLKGHSVRCAANGDDGLRSLTSSEVRPEVILLDLEMPVLDGWQFLSEMRKQPDLSDIPVVVMSGFGGIAEKAKELGAAAVVRKPVEPRALLELVDHFSTRA